MPEIRVPDESELAGCSEWCAPLHMVDDTIRGQEFATFFDVDHFMIMGQVLRRGRPDIFLYKHGHTRRYLNLDAAGHAYRYLPPRDIMSTYPGQYRPHRDLIAAIDHLRLFELPWLCGSGFEAARGGLAWEDRFDSPHVIAWFERRWPSSA